MKLFQQILFNMAHRRVLPVKKDAEPAKTNYLHYNIRVNTFLLSHTIVFLETPRLARPGWGFRCMPPTGLRIDTPLAAKQTTRVPRVSILMFDEIHLDDNGISFVGGF